MEKWVVIKDGEVKCYGTSQQTFPSADIIKTLQVAGYKIYVDGKLYTKQKGRAMQC